MGYSITWCAVREEAAAAFLVDTGLSPTGKFETEPESPLCMAKLTSGWRVFWSNRYDCSVLTKNLASFSEAHEVLVCRVDEHVMASSSELWLSGVRKWRISHLGEDGPSGVETDGELPECFASIREELEVAQRAEGGEEAEVDYIFDIPLKVAQSLVGLKHDEDWESIVVDGFETLSGGEQRKGFFARLFGR
jgi:hypothetical protein